MCVTCTLSSEKKGGRRLETESLTLMWVVQHNKKLGGAYFCWVLHQSVPCALILLAAVFLLSYVSNGFEASALHTGATYIPL